LKLKLAGPGVQLQELARDDIDLVAAFGDEHQLAAGRGGNFVVVERLQVAFVGARTRVLVQASGRRGLRR